MLRTRGQANRTKRGGRQAAILLLNPPPGRRESERDSRTKPLPALQGHARYERGYFVVGADTSVSKSRAMSGPLETPPAYAVGRHPKRAVGVRGVLLVQRGSAGTVGTQDAFSPPCTTQHVSTTAGATQIVKLRAQSCTALCSV